LAGAWVLGVAGVMVYRLLRGRGCQAADGLVGASATSHSVHTQEGGG
jgi:hypothetical protein